MTIWCLLTGTVVVEGKKSIRLGHMTKPFFWQQHGQSKVNDRLLCRKGECVKCWKSRATASVHIDCLYGFIQSETYEDKFHRLWRFAQARRPHPTIPSVLLPAPLTHVTLKVPEDSSPKPSDPFSKGFLKQVAGLPQEILTGTRELSPASPVWHISAGQALSHSLSLLPPPPLQTEYKILPLDDIASWDRGQGIDNVVRRNDEAQSGQVRLVMDAYGIRKVETVPFEQDDDDAPHQGHDDIVFITVPKSNFGECQATFAVLTARSPNLPLTAMMAEADIVYRMAG